MDKRDSSDTDDADIKKQIKRMEKEVDGDNSESSEEFQVFSDDENQGKKKMGAYTAKSNLNYDEMIQRKKPKRRNS